MRQEPNNVMIKGEEPILPETYEVSEFDKKRVPKEGIHFETNVIVRPVEEGTESKYLKQGQLSYNLPGWGSWEVMCDEGTTGGGTDTAPSPLGYLSLGVAFCLMTHLKETIMRDKLDIKAIKIEQRVKFHSTYNFGNIKVEDIYGYTKSLETNIVVESDEPNDKIERLAELSQQACMAANAFITAVPESTRVFHNGDQLV